MCLGFLRGQTLKTVETPSKKLNFAVLQCPSSGRVLYHPLLPQPLSKDDPPVYPDFSVVEPDAQLITNVRDRMIRSPNFRRISETRKSCRPKQKNKHKNYQT